MNELAVSFVFVNYNLHMDHGHNNVTLLEISKLVTISECLHKNESIWEGY